MEFPCEVCDNSINEKESKQNQYISTLKKENDKSFREKFTINNPDLSKVDKIITDYITHHHKKFDLYFYQCEFKSEFNSFTQHIETLYSYNRDNIGMKSYYFFWIDYLTLGGYTFSNISEMIIKTFSNKCKITYEHYLKQSMHMCERLSSRNIVENPQLIKSLDRIKKHYFLIGKYSHIPISPI